MSQNGKHALDLDALFGAQTPVTLTWGGHEYELKRPEALGPRALMQLQGMQKRARSLENFGATVTKAQSEDLERVTQEMLVLLCPALEKVEPVMPFAAQLRTLLWYFEQVAPKDAAALEKKMAARTYKRTMAKSSRRSRSGTVSGSRT